MMNESPFVSALLVTRNEEEFIERALLSLINQTYPKTRYEIIVIDGESTDGTLDIVNQLICQYSSDIFSIRVISNPKRILATGWNIGIKNASGDYVVRIDAHGEVASDFLEKSVNTILSIPDTICVGGKLNTKSINGDDNTVSKVLSSPFGVGNSSFRISNKPGYSDTVVYGLYKKEIFEEVGYFNEKYVRNQDIEFHSRIRKAGGKFYFNPEINCVYYSRNTVKKMLKQAFSNGEWNMVLLKHQTNAVRLRHLVPLAFVLYIIASTFLGFYLNYFWYLELGILLVHLIVGIIASLNKTKKISDLVKMPFMFLLLHIFYGAGYFAGIFIKID